MKKPVVDPNELYTIPETCSILGIDRRTLNRYTAAGAIKSHIRKADNRIVYFGSDITRCYYTVA
jgi:predicted site-specific integrase-resolvase